MAGVSEMHFGSGIVALKGLGTLEAEEWIAFAPNRQYRRTFVRKYSWNLG
jgi:hypothetical protein